MSLLNRKAILMGTAAALAVAISTAIVMPTDAGAQGQRYQGQGGQGMRGGAGGDGMRGGGSSTLESRVIRGSGRRIIIIIEEGDDDSDRPAWAMGNPDLNPHATAGGGKPAGAGTMKGGDYGDLVEIWRDLETGLPILVVWTDTDDDGIPDTWEESDSGFVQPLDADGEKIPLDAEGEVFVLRDENGDPIVDENGDPVLSYLDDVVEVDFGRSSIARAPSKVIAKSLDEAIKKLTLEDVVIGTDLAGRITYTVPYDVDSSGTIEEGETLTRTIDSPLENLALYIAITKALVDAEDLTDAQQNAFDLLGSLATLDTAASLFAGVADKTGEITLDYVMYQNVITGIATLTDATTGVEYYDLSSFTYVRTYPDLYSYWYFPEGAEAPVARDLNVVEYLEAINGALSSSAESADLFAAAADDALAIIDLMHTQIVTDLLPGTVPIP